VIETLICRIRAEIVIIKVVIDLNPFRPEGISPACYKQAVDQPGTPNGPNA